MGGTSVCSQEFFCPRGGSLGIGEGDWAIMFAFDGWKISVRRMGSVVCGGI